MHPDLHFYLACSSLLIIVAYVIMVFRNVDPLIATFIGLLLGFLFNQSTPLAMGQYLEHGLSSFLALVGFIIMLGRGLGEVLTETKVNHTLVYKIVYSIGVNTVNRVKIGVIVSSIVIVGVLGTLAGGLAILAPILRPIAAKVKLNSASLGVLMQASGEEALILGPFTPPVITILGVTSLSYPNMLFHIALPISIVTLVTSWIMASKLQKQYYHEQIAIDLHLDTFTPSNRQKVATTLFVLTFILAVIYGLATHATTSFVIVVMLLLALITGLVSKLTLNKIFALLISGMQKNLHLFLIFVLLDPFLNLIQAAGGFHAITQIFTPLAHLGGKPMLAIIIGLTGAFGMPAAAVAVIKMLHDLFLNTAISMQLTTTMFAFSMLIATRITNFAYPGANMFAAMGFAGSENMKAMIKNGLTVTMVQVTFLILYAYLFSYI